VKNVLTGALSMQPSRVLRIILVTSALVALAAVCWQALPGSGALDPLAPPTGQAAAVVDITILVFREGLECVLVLAAVAAGLASEHRSVRTPIAIGAGVGFAATLLTWVVAVHILDDLSKRLSALALQAATGLLAIVVLLVVMNWFFHSIYWSGWISLHNRRKRRLLQAADSRPVSKIFWGMGLLGFASLYREGFEVVLFLQSYRLRLGNQAVLWGAAVGTLLSGAVAVLTFLAHRRLPYRKMLVLTGILLGIVLIVMVGEQAQEMQLAHWIPTTTVPALTRVVPSWMSLWFSVFPTVETLLAQAAAALVVLGSYVAANRPMRSRDGRLVEAAARQPAQLLQWGADGGKPEDSYRAVARATIAQHGGGHVRS
jgi:high-affinity iron transporter